MAVNSPNSPRQKMINLMYLVFIAMLALNVSTEVLDGFGIVENSLKDSSKNISDNNDIIVNDINDFYSRNPEKIKEWHDKSSQLKNSTDSILTYIDDLKYKLVREADGKNADVNNIKNKDNTDVANKIMLSPISGEGEKLRNSINNYRNMVLGMTQNMNKGSKVSLSLNTDDYDNKSWESVMFENVPLAAVTTILTKIQNDILVAEGEALKGIVENINFSNFIVNELDAYVIPESEIVIRGSSSTARLVISAVDTTKTYSIFLNNEVKSIDSDGKFEIPTNSVGTHPLNGYVELISNDGSNVRRSFGTSYTVVEPIATIAPTLMNVLYAGIENEISISVPGIAPNDISASMTNGTLYKKGNKWIAKPINIDQSTVITVSARSGNGKVMHMSGNEFKVRKLPDPTPYISYTDANGKSVMFKGGQISKSTILNSSGVGASIDDGILNIPFAVKNFRTIFFDSMGNAIPEFSDGNRFSERQKEQIRRLPRGSYFYVSGIRAVGPDNIEREIAVMEVRIR